ncbi:hypothetical protein [Brucella cytisi]|uniref:Uncharacterized protein n=1 Tax=Brucella cytisi TaxID=407152 RepID=A0A1J6I5M5_9HYPH|nr:hypothetical protein [Brucella cytisi]OIS90232.1 hypothetical protein BLA27_27890 [Brucella cytisi]
MRDPKEGVSLAAIVAAETKDGEWSGAGGGLGLGIGGIGVFAGGATGSNREQSKRAQDFEAPEQSKFDWQSVYSPVIGAVMLGAIAIATSSMSKMFMGGHEPGSKIDRVQSMLGNIMTVMGIAVPILCLLFAGYYVIFGSAKAVAKENKRLERLEQLQPIRESVYYRLRYVEADHVVFDPVTGRETPAERNRILQLLDELAKAEMPETGKA